MGHIYLHTQHFFLPKVPRLQRVDHLSQPKIAKCLGNIVEWLAYRGCAILAAPRCALSLYAFVNIDEKAGLVG
jgi:hypothetical protein